MNNRVKGKVSRINFRKLATLGVVAVIATSSYSGMKALQEYHIIYWLPQYFKDNSFERNKTLSYDYLKDCKFIEIEDKDGVAQGIYIVKIKIVPKDIIWGQHIMYVDVITGNKVYDNVDNGDFENRSLVDSRSLVNYLYETDNIKLFYTEEELIDIRHEIYMKVLDERFSVRQSNAKKS